MIRPAGIVVASGLVLAVLAVGACTQDAERPSLDGILGNPEPIQLGGDNAARSSLSGGCEDFGSLTGDALGVKITTSFQSTSYVPTSRPQPTKLTVIATGAAGAALGKSVPLGAGENKSFATCAQCIVVAIGCGADCSRAAMFFPRSGTATITSLAQDDGSSAFTGRFENVELEQVTVDLKTQATTTVAGGACIRIPLLSFRGTPSAAPPPAGDAGASSSSGTSGGSSSGGSSSGGSSSGGSSSGTGSSSGHQSDPESKAGLLL